MADGLHWENRYKEQTRKHVIRMRITEYLCSAGYYFNDELKIDFGDNYCVVTYESGVGAGVHQPVVVREFVALFDREGTNMIGSPVRSDDKTPTSKAFEA